jgi:LysM repeat protein
MARLRNIRTGSWPVIIGVGLVVVVAWGLYAWRFAGLTPKQQSEPAVASNADGSAPSDEKITPLRATRPVSSANDPIPAPDDALNQDTPADSNASEASWLSMRVTANAPPSSDHGVETTLAVGRRSTPPSALRRLDAGRTALNRGDLITARTAFSAALDAGLGRAEAASTRAELRRIADALLFSRATVPGDPLTGVHVVSSGESLGVIARRYKITDDLLVSINHVADPNRVHVGRRLKVIHGPFHAVIDKSDHRMDIFLGDVCVDSYHVGLGTNGGTPLGSWAIGDKLRNPEWTDPVTGRRYLADDPDNPIGEHWIGLRGLAGEALGRIGFGLHGTIDPASIGENMSMGCIRLLPRDIALAYDLLVSRHSRVVIK